MAPTWNRLMKLKLHWIIRKPMQNQHTHTHDILQVQNIAFPWAPPGSPGLRFHCRRIQRRIQEGLKNERRLKAGGETTRCGGGGGGGLRDGKGNGGIVGEELGKIGVFFTRSRWFPTNRLIHTAHITAKSSWFCESWNWENASQLQVMTLLILLKFI